MSIIQSLAHQNPMHVTSILRNSPVISPPINEPAMNPLTCALEYDLLEEIFEQVLSFIAGQDLLSSSTFPPIFIEASSVVDIHARRISTTVSAVVCPLSSE